MLSFHQFRRIPFVFATRTLACALAVSLMASQAVASNTVTVTPDTLRTALYSGDTSVLSGLNTLYAAKEEVNRARANLLPGVALSGVVGGHPTFAVSAISVLLPFLLPSNWHALDASKHQLTANGYAYQLVLLNDYASILSIYAQIQGDMEIRDVYVQQRDNLRQIAAAVADEVAVGTALQSDLDQATAQVQLAQAQINQVDELIARERAALRKVMGLPLSKDLVIASYHFPELDAEGMSAQRIYNRVRDTAPEQLQIDSLIAAAKSAKYTTEWSFLTGTSLSVSTNFGQSSFGHLSAGGGVNLGFGMLPAIHLSSLDIAAMQIRKREISLEQQNVIETAINSVDAAKDAVTNAGYAKENYQKALQAELDKLRLGQSTLINVFTVSNFATQAGLTYANSLVDLDNQRIALNRVLISNQFAKIPTCHLQKAKSGGVFGFFKSLFGSKKKRYVSIDEICRPSADAAAVARGSRR
jgi:outer membrane protein TolC